MDAPNELIQTRKQNYPSVNRTPESMELTANEEKFIAELQKDPTNITRAARLAFPDAKDASQKGWQILQKDKVWRKYQKAMKVWNKILDVPKLLKNLNDSLNAMKLVSVEDTGTAGKNGQTVYVEREVPDHQARNTARAQALNILGILDKNKLLGSDENGAPIQMIVMGKVILKDGTPLEIKVGD